MKVRHIRHNAIWTMGGDKVINYKLRVDKRLAQYPFVRAGWFWGW